jgi:hypothetical protein
MKKSIGDNMIPKDWTFERGLELVKKAGVRRHRTVARRSPGVSDEQLLRSVAKLDASTNLRSPCPSQPTHSM